ncbi:MAG TPA: beta-N-acetylhexosaminidase [Acetobacteraceae bacterium]|nr:beta-N-acetylhexosaminidase [Acetobacteraceae bacterium]
MKAAIVGVAGPRLLPAEAELFRAHPPAGVILFARNVQNPGQLAALRRAIPGDALLMVDQEGGRVARLRPPHWRAHPPAAAHGRLYAGEHRAGLRAAWLTGALIGADCRQAGFDVVAAPVLDLAHPGASDVIGDRAFGSDPSIVALLARAVADGLLAAGIQPVGKHAPGHGRALVDSHLTLPRVHAADLRADLLPFALLAHLPWLMTAHIVYAAWDPHQPATLSPAVVQGIIRGRLGFGGVLVSDDLAMGAVSGSPAERAVQALAAGCDLALYCAGDLERTAELLAAVPPLSAAASARLAAARSLAESRRLPLDPAALAAERDRLFA